MNAGLIAMVQITEESALHASHIIWTLFLIFISLALYMLPTAVAHKKPQFGSVFALNFFLGWTFVGWVIALAWALKNPESKMMFANGPAVGVPVLCTACGRYSQPESKFCQSCGRELRAAPPIPA